jgi:hypothetical protein
MRFLADENFPGPAVTALKAAGHDVTWVKIAKPGTSDAEVLAWAMRVPSQKSGVVLLRTPPSKTSEGLRSLVDLISTRVDWIGHFSIVESGRVRMRPLP